jgi:putative endonuclease
MYKNRLGRRGELIAKNFLLKKGLSFVKANVRFERAEVDLVFKDEENKILVFVEVKTRTNKSFGEPEESVTPPKMEQIRKAAMGFVSEHSEFDEFDLRMDVITIMITGDRTEVNHIENAF